MTDPKSLLKASFDNISNKFNTISQKLTSEPESFSLAQSSYLLAKNASLEELKWHKLEMAEQHLEDAKAELLSQDINEEEILHLSTAIKETIEKLKGHTHHEEHVRGATP